MEGILNKLEPNCLWELFEEICQYPRPSKKEEIIAKYIVDFGNKLGLDVKKDEMSQAIKKWIDEGLTEKYGKQSYKLK